MRTYTEIQIITISLYWAKGEVSKKLDSLNILCTVVIYNLDFSPLKSGSKW